MNRHMLCSIVRFSRLSLQANAPQHLSTSSVVMVAKKKMLDRIRGPRPTPIPHPTSAEISFNPPDPRNEVQESAAQKAEDGKSSSLVQEQNDGPEERIMSTGNISKAAQRIKPDDSRDENDGSLETKEELSPGSADKAELAKHAKKETADDVPLEVKQNLHKDTIEFLHNQSGKSAQGHGG